MAVFANGRLIVSPATVVTIDDSALANQNLSVGNVVALIGKSIGGEPNKALRFGSPSDAKATLRGGELLTAVLKAFDPSAQTNGPSQVVAVRVDLATRASLILKDTNGADVISLLSTDFGAYTNQLKLKVETASSAGRKLTTQFGNDFFTKDNITRNAFRVRYVGAQVSAVMTINGTQIVLQAPSGTTVATLDLSVHKTMLEVVDRINAVTGFTASVLDGNGSKVSLNGLDFVTAVDVRTADYTVKADLQAAIDWFNDVGEGFVTATRASGAGLPPVNVSFTYLSGAVDGTVTNNEWSNAYITLQGVDVQWVCPITSDASIHAMNDAHCAFMSNVAQSYRRGFVGTALSTPDADAIAAAKALNSDRTSLVHIGFNDFDADGKLVLLPPYMLAAMLAGAFSGLNPGTAMTNKSLKVRGLERIVRNPTDTDQLINGGVLPVESTPAGFKVVKSISTWLVNANFNRVEVSVGAAADFVSRELRNAVDILRGEKANQQTLSRAASIVDSRCRELARAEPQGPGVLAGNAENPPYKNISVSIDGDVLSVQVQVSLVVPVNYIPISIFAALFSGSAAA